MIILVVTSIYLYDHSCCYFFLIQPRKECDSAYSKVSTRVATGTIDAAYISAFRICQTLELPEEVLSIISIAFYIMI